MFKKEHNYEWDKLEKRINIKNWNKWIVYLIILYRILNLASKTKSIKGRYICIGVSTYIFLHIFINLGGLFGLIPLTGVPLPLLSYGGSFTLSLLLSLAVVQRIHIENKNQKIKIW